MKCSGWLLNYGVSVLTGNANELSIRYASFHPLNRGKTQAVTTDNISRVFSIHFSWKSTAREAEVREFASPLGV
jgi:hypothetical protein